jgi:predicted GH43/DUF377 family glycosyl hydrolase
MFFAAGEIAALTVKRPDALRDVYLLSPFVWREAARYRMLLRVVPRSDDPAKKIARVHYGESGDGLHFTLHDTPAIAPGAQDDKDGCEDPTLCIVGGRYYVYYTGWDERAKRGQLLLAEGSDVLQLKKCGTILPWSPERKNPKEATVVQAKDGSWRMFFEYAADEKSKIGLAHAPAVNGPWTIAQPLFEARAGSWDDWHLSTGPIVSAPGGEPVMFYNGATRDAKWRIGWIAFDAQYSRVADRCGEPLIVPPAQHDADATDIAFAASAVTENGAVQIYYSVADQDMCRAAVSSS